jgi:butyryl-CoA dehydrogenase
MSAGSLDFLLDEDQEMLRREVRRFAEERIAPGRQERDRQHTFPADIIAELGTMGLLGMLVPETHGGAGIDVLGYCVAIEELARICPSVAVTVSVSNSVCCWPLVHFAAPELQRKVLPELAGGALGGFCLTEPEAGSDAGSLRTSARRDGDHFVLSGEKAWITNAAHARWLLVLARTDPGGGKRGISAFAVRTDTPGLTVGPPEEKMGLNASNTCSVSFHDCRVPADHLVGELGQGFKIALATLDHSRLGIAAQAVGIHQRALELATTYAKERVQFGRPIAEHQAIRFSLAKIATELAAARALTWAAAAKADSGSREAARLASEAKVYASEAANRACYEALQIHGGNGFSAEYEISRLYRDVRVTTIYEGTSEMQRLVIARHLGAGVPESSRGLERP